MRSSLSLAGCALLLGCGGGGAGGLVIAAGYGAAFPAHDVRLDSDPVPGRYPSHNPRIARDGDSIFVVWSDARDSTSSIRLRHSSDAGLSWSPADVRVDHKPPGFSDSTNPRLVVLGETVFVVWEDYRSGRADAYFNRSLDGGATWLEDDRRLDTDTPGAASSVHPVIATDGLHVIAAWSDDRSVRADLHVNRSQDGGLTWAPSDARIDTDLPGAAASVDPEIALSGGSVVVVWADGRVQFTDIRMNRSVDYGVTWLANDRRLDSDGEGISPSSHPLVVAEGATFFVVFEDGRSGAPDIRFNRSLDLGANWLGHDVRLDTDAPGLGASLAPAIAVSGGAVYVVWQDGRDGLLDVRFNRSDDAGSSWLATDVRLDEGIAGTAPSQAVDVSASGGNVFVAWQDGRVGRADIYVQASIDGGRTFMPHERRIDTDAPGVGASLLPRIACDGPSVSVVFEDERDGAADIRFTRSP